MRTRTIRIMLSILFVLSVIPGFAANGQIRETMLPNGLKVLTKEVHTAPVVSFHVWYKVGSRNEQFGKTGLSHLLEHMQFKGTKTLKKGEIDHLIQRNGGLSNAATWKDFTYYWETLSSDKLELAMRIESDRMTNSLIDPKEFKSEMVVVRSELEGKENSPDYLLFYELYADAFKAHPYHWPTIGWVHDVENIQRDELYKYYKTNYEPNNATVVIVGDFDTDKTLAMVRKHFGGIPKGPEPPKVTALEPVQLGEKRAVVRKAGISPRVMMGYHIPALGNPDVYALDVLETILSTGTSSRLYKGLVDKQLATEAWASNGAAKDPDLFIMGGTARNGVKIEAVESALLAEVDRIKSAPISDEELQKAMNQAEAQFIFGNDSVSDQADRLGQYETEYSWHYLDSYLANVRKVTKADVQRVAKQYLTENNRTVVTFIPEPGGPGASEMPISSGERLKPNHGLGTPEYKTDSGALSHRDASVLSKNPKSEIRNPQSPNPKLVTPTRVVLDNGMVVIVYPNRSNPTVAVQGSLNAGDILDPQGEHGLAQITADLLMKGTKKRTADQIASQTDFAAISMNTGADTEHMGFSGYSLTKNVDLLFDLLSDVLRNPTFPAEEFDKIKALRYSSIKEQQDDPESLAGRAFYGSIFPVGHPYHRLSVEDELANAMSFTREDVTGFYKAHYGPQGAIIVIVGDIDPQAAISKVKSYFGDWRTDAVPVRPSIPNTPLQTEIVKKVIPVPDKSEVQVMLGYSGGLKRSDPDYYPAQVMNFILGGGGALGSRLGTVIRDDMGLVYSVYTGFDATLGAGPWFASLGTNPKNTDKAINALNEQIAKLRDKGATEQEMKDAVDFLTGSFPARRLEKNSTIAETLYLAEFYGLGMDYIRKYQSLYRAVTLDQVNAAAKKYLHPDKYTLVISGAVGNAVKH